VNIFRRKKLVPAKKLITGISKRAEDLSPKEQANSFVSMGQLENALLNRDNRILFGRRGTGKTHIFSYVSSRVREAGEIPIQIDFRTIGSNSSIYSDSTKSKANRATHLIRDLMEAIYYRVLEENTNPQSPISKIDLSVEIEGLSDSVKTVLVTDSVEKKIADNASEYEKQSLDARGSVSLTNYGVEVEAGISEETYEGKDGSREKLIKSTPKLSVNAGKCFEAVRNLTSKLPCRTWLLLDEWSAIPEPLQPYLADFLRRCFFPIQNLSVQIAAIEFRSKFRIHDGEKTIGFELGSDIFADLNLDDFSVYDNSPEVSSEFFKELLYRHLVALCQGQELAESNSNAVISAVFSQDRAFRELVRASEGVPRDFINILQIAILRSKGGSITVPIVRDSAKDWYERDKQRNLDMNYRARQLLEFVRDQVITNRKARAFLLDSEASDPAIEYLFDERLLHIAKRSYSAQDVPGVRFQVWKVDYGCYVDLMNTVRTPTGFLFEDMELSDGGEIIVPEDDLRAIRRAILDLSEFNPTPVT